VSIMKTNQLLLYTETVSIYCETHKHINTLGEEEIDFLNVTPNGGVRGAQASTDICVEQMVNIVTTGT
jgi:6-phosphogluconate dehydrogenase (decarboxylating)